MVLSGLWTGSRRMAWREPGLLARGGRAVQTLVRFLAWIWLVSIELVDRSVSFFLLVHSLYSSRVNEQS